MFSRHYILVLRAEVGNWFYICKRAVKLSWLSFQYLNTLGHRAASFRFILTVSCLQLFFVYISSLKIIETCKTSAEQSDA